MSNLLVRDALDAVWGVPDPFNQVILNPKRITPFGGRIRQFVQSWNRYTLPNPTSIFHLYQVGQINPALIDLFALTTKWQTLSEMSTQTQVVLDCYTSLGLQIPKTRTWCMITENKNVVFAVEYNPRLKYDFDRNNIFVRFYRNAYYELQGLSTLDRIAVSGGKMTTLESITALHIEINTLLAAPGYRGGLCCYINGYKSPVINVATVKIGDVAEYVYDGSIYKVADFKITSLPSFDSTLDQKGKSLLHYEGNAEGGVDYVDEIDVYMIDSVTQKGVYVNKNASDTLRMVTYKDYAIVTSYLTPYFEQFKDASGVVDINRLYLRLHIRFAGHENLPILERHQTKYLMKMPDTKIQQALLGVNSSLAVWRAPALEASAYAEVMRSNYRQITPALVEKAYGYTKAQHLLANTPTRVIAGHATVTVPPAFQLGAMAFEYAANGLLLGYHAVAMNSIVYSLVNPLTVLVEFMAGTGSAQLDEHYTADPLPLSSNHHYRYYVSIANETTGIPKWHDVTGNTDHYVTEAGISNWHTNNHPNVLKRLVRSDKQFLLYQTELVNADGVLTHSLRYTQNTLNGQLVAGLSIPLGELDLWLNNVNLIEGIDYLVNYPSIRIISKKHLVAVPGTQTLTVRFTGFSDDELNRTPTKSIGFVHQGNLSVNGRYELHHDRSERIIVGGMLYAQDELTYIENLSVGNTVNGTPYSIRDYVCPLNGLLTQDAYRYRKASIELEQGVSDYLSFHMPQVVIQPVVTIGQRYSVYSHFLSKIIYDLKNSYLVNPALTDQYSDDFVSLLCQPYLHLLKQDVLLPENTPDLRYCVIHPHWLDVPIELNVTDYRFVTNVVRIYGRGLVDLTTHVTISG